MIKIDRAPSPRIQQGDIFRDIDFVQKVEIVADEVFIHQITFPLVIVLTQDCDLEQDSEYYINARDNPSTDDKKLLSAIVAPLYNEGLFLQGEHLNDETINYKMRSITKKNKEGNLTTEYRYLIENAIPRYHHLKFEENDPLVDSVIDFKHYFTLNIEELMRIKGERFVCKVSELYREHISQRFAYFLSRIGLPNMQY